MRERVINFKKLFFTIFILAGFLFLNPFSVWSQEIGGDRAELDALNKQIEERKERVKQIEASIEEYKKKINQKRLESVSLGNQLSILENRAAQIELDIQATEERISALALEIESLELVIADKEKKIDRQKVMISEMVQEIYQRDRRGYLEILAVYENFSDFYNRLQSLQKVERDLGKNAKSIRLAKEELQAEKVKTEERKKEREQTVALLQEKKKDLEEENFQKQNLLSQTKSSELVFTTLLGNLKQQYQGIEGEIANIEREIRKKLESEKKLSDLSEDTGALSWPVPSRYVTSYFHDPDYPYRHIFEHNGIDIRASQGTAVRAASSGYIARTKRCSLASCYSYVMIVHGGEISTVYGHLSSISVQEDQFVTTGDVIGLSGGTKGTVGAGPFVTGPHLHFEVRKNGIPVNPANFLSGAVN